MRLLVTGGNGFLGEYVLTEAARRDHETVALARSYAAAVTVARRGGQSLTGDRDDPARLPGVFGTAHCEALVKLTSLGLAARGGAGPGPHRQGGTRGYWPHRRPGRASQPDGTARPADG